MKLVSWNVNGLRAICRKGFEQWLAEAAPDIVSMQEVRACLDQWPASLREGPYHIYTHEAEKKGYSGVAVMSRSQPLEVIEGMGLPEVDREGRILTLRFEHFTLVDAYMPHARRDLSRKDFKLAFCEAFFSWLAELKASGQRVVLCGDYNMSHTELDLTNARANRNNAGFLPEERAWMDRFLAMGFHDVFREAHPEEKGYYTWWSNRKGVRERNVGWRIDYHCVDEALLPYVKGVGHLDQVLGSDHCPIYLDLEF